jgi:hypothetical protein
MNILSNPAFHIVGVPLIFALIGVFANRLGRRDNDDEPEINDWAVGTTILLTLLGTIAADLPLSSNGGNISTVSGWFTGVLFTLFISIDNDRFRSWERDAQGLPTKRKHLYWGVIAPIIVCSALFVLYQYGKVSIP